MNTQVPRSAKPLHDRLPCSKRLLEHGLISARANKSTRLSTTQGCPEGACTMDAMAGLSRGALVLDWTRCRGPMYCLHWMSGCTMRSDAPGLARETRPPAIVPSVDSHAAQRRAESSWHYACAQPHYTHVSLVIAAQGTECERLNEWVMVVQAIRPQTCARSDSPNDVKSLNPGHDIQIGRENCAHFAKSIHPSIHPSPARCCCILYLT